MLNSILNIDNCEIIVRYLNNFCKSEFSIRRIMSFLLDIRKNIEMLCSIRSV